MKAVLFIYTYIILFAKSMSFVHIVISIPVNDSFFAQISFVSIIQVLQFVDSVVYMYTYIERVPFVGFSQGPRTTLIRPWASLKLNTAISFAALSFYESTD